MFCVCFVVFCERLVQRYVCVLCVFCVCFARVLCLFCVCCVCVVCVLCVFCVFCVCFVCVFFFEKKGKNGKSESAKKGTHKNVFVFQDIDFTSFLFSRTMTLHGPVEKKVDFSEFLQYPPTAKKTDFEGKKNGKMTFAQIIR